MNLLSPIAGPVFRLNHGLMMRHGEQGATATAVVIRRALVGVALVLLVVVLVLAAEVWLALRRDTF